MADTTVVPLDELSQRLFRFISAEWWESDSKFVLVRGHNSVEDFALRLDLDKQSFLDHVEDKETEELLKKSAHSIAAIVWGARIRSSSRTKTRSA
jgi:hypothetical protein